MRIRWESGENPVSWSEDQPPVSVQWGQEDDVKVNCYCDLLRRGIFVGQWWLTSWAACVSVWVCNQLWRRPRRRPPHHLICKFDAVRSGGVLGPFGETGPWGKTIATTATTTTTTTFLRRSSGCLPWALAYLTCSAYSESSAGLRYLLHLPFNLINRRFSSYWSFISARPR